LLTLEPAAEQPAGAQPLPQGSLGIRCTATHRFRELKKLLGHS
jgi:hypothetical protein